MNGTLIDGSKVSWGAERPDGHRIRLDVLLSALQKGIRRCDAAISLWATALLCRGELWMEAFQALLHCAVEETNALTEPFARSQILKIARRLRPQLTRKGVDVNTDLSRKLMYELCIELTLATKSRMCVHAMIASYSFIAEGAKDLRGTLPVSEDELLLMLFRQFKKYYEDKDEGNTLKWLSLLDMFGEHQSVYGSAKVWRFLKKIPGVEDLSSLTDVFRSDPYAAKILLYEAVLYHFYPARSNAELKGMPLRRVSLSQRNSYASTWKKMWDLPMDPELRNVIDWNTWHPIILDSSTAVGKNRDTYAELRLRYPDFPAEQFAPPDYAGVSHPSLILHDFATCQLLHSRILTDAYEVPARTFLSHIERGHSLPILGKGFECTELFTIRKGLRRLLQPTHINIGTGRDVAEKDRVSSLSLSLTERKRDSRSSLSLSSFNPDDDTPGSSDDTDGTVRGNRMGAGNRVRANSADPLRSHSSNYTPCPLPGYTVEHQDIVSGPVSLDGLSITYCHLAEVPVVGTFPRWFVGLSDRTTWIVQRSSEMLTTIPIFLDRIKGRFGLPSVGFRYLENAWLVMRDPGKGGPYPTLPTGQRRYETVRWPDAGILSLVSPDFVWTDAVLEQVTKVLLFRALFRVMDSTLATVLWSEREKKVYPWAEVAVSQDPYIDGKDDPFFVANKENLLEVLLCRGRQYLPAYNPEDPAVQPLLSFWKRSGTRGKVWPWLVSWEMALYDVPQPPRPLHELPNLSRLQANLRYLRLYWSE